MNKLTGGKKLKMTRTKKQNKEYMKKYNQTEKAKESKRKWLEKNPNCCKKWRNKNIKYARDYDKKRYKIRKDNENYKAQQRKGQIKYNLKYPNKIKAHNISNMKIKIPKGQICQYPKCKKLATEKHHEDYSKPLEVKFLCIQHHSKLRRKEF